MPRLPYDDPRLAEVLKLWGVPYVYGAGRPADALRGDWYFGVQSSLPAAPQPHPRGYDCSGLVQVLSVRTGGPIKATDQDRNTAALYKAARVIVGEPDAEFGDFVFYGRPGAPDHVMFALGGGAVFGACSGTPQTFGLDPRALCDFRRLRYWGAFIGVRRIPAA